MCGIVGYLGKQPAVPILLDGLKRLEYRGYDSAGLAACGGNGSLYIRRSVGKLCNLETLVGPDAVMSACGIGHTRWATHGKPTEANAHPHSDCHGSIAVVHNGILENYAEIKRELESEGHRMVTDTDTEILAHLIERYSNGSGSIETAVRKAISKLRGSFAFAVISQREPSKLVVARLGPPIVVGVGDEEYFVASDVTAVQHHTQNVCFLMDGDLAVLSPGGMKLGNFHGDAVDRSIQQISWDPTSAEKAGYKHFMLKEIFEQPRAVRNTLSGRADAATGRVNLDEMGIDPDAFAKCNHLNLVGCGTSWHAALAGKYMIEQLAKLKVDVDYGSEFRYRNPIVQENDVTVLLSQSGETADTLAAQREAKERGCTTAAICNVPGSMITREADGTLYTRAGPEIGVASTKAFTCQLTALFTLAAYMSQARGLMTREESQKVVRELIALPDKIEQALREVSHCADLARRFVRATDFLFLGRGIHFPIALEGALKLKEISYIHAEGYPAGEMKHGPNALIDKSMPVVFLATHDPADARSCARYEKTLGNIKEVQARDGTVIAVANRGDSTIAHNADHVIEVPPTNELLLPIVEIVPLQLLAYHIALRRGCDVDQPRNLAKSVTVE